MTASIAAISAVTAANYGITVADLHGPSRERRIAWPRQVAFLLARELTVRSYPEIGQRFGGRDHTTVLHGVKAVRARIARSPAQYAEVQQLRQQLGQIA